VRRVVVLAALALVAAGCGGGSNHAAPPATATTVTKPPPGKLLYAGGVWGVTTSGARATAWHLVRGVWHADRTGAVKIEILGPKPGSKVAAIPQVAIEMKAKTPLVESGLWVDGVELFEKGGGLDPRVGTIYGAPAHALTPGLHTAVGYGRTATHGTAIAWTFRV